MKIEKGRRVHLKVRLQVVEGEEIEKSVVEYIHGTGKMLPGLEKNLDGLEKGAKSQGVIKAKNAFGDASFQREKRMSRKEFPAETEFQVGARFAAKGADNRQDVILEVIAVDDESVTVQLRHPLADSDIEYEVEILSVTDTTPPPLPPDAVEMAEIE